MTGWRIAMTTAGGTAVAAMVACTPQPPAEVAGRALFAENCAVCHGTEGRGDGPAAAAMSPPPVDLTLLSRTNGGSFPLVAVMSYIDGYTRDGRDGMPAFGADLDGPLVMVDTGDGILTPTPAPLVALADHVESLQR